MLTCPEKQAEVDAHFERLQARLRFSPLPVTGGGRRIADADEFMLMCMDRTVAHFKHRHTRCYLLLSPDGGLVHKAGAVFDAYPY